MRGVGIVFSRFLEVDITQGVIIGMVIVAFFAVLGGMKGITWTQVVQYVVLIIAYLIPAIAIAWMITGIPIPQVALPVSDIAARLNGIHEELGLAPYTEPFATRSQLNVFCLMLALMVGTAGLPHVIVRFYTTRDVSSARLSGLYALLFIAILYTTAPALALFARYNLVETLHDTPIEDARGLDWVNKWETTGLLHLDDKDGDGMLRWSPSPEENEVTINNDIIVLAAPEVARLAPG
jgi:cation/acetate symporter